MTSNTSLTPLSLLPPPIPSLLEEVEREENSIISDFYYNYPEIWNIINSYKNYFETKDLIPYILERSIEEAKSINYYYSKDLRYRIYNDLSAIDNRPLKTIKMDIFKEFLSDELPYYYPFNRREEELIDLIGIKNYHFIVDLLLEEVLKRNNSDLFFTPRAGKIHNAEYKKVNIKYKILKSLPPPKITL